MNSDYDRAWAAAHWLASKNAAQIRKVVPEAVLLEVKEAMVVAGEHSFAGPPVEYETCAEAEIDLHEMLVWETKTDRYEGRTSKGGRAVAVVKRRKIGAG